MMMTATRRRRRRQKQSEPLPSYAETFQCLENSDDQIKENEMGRARSVCGWRKGACWVLVGKPEGRRPLGMPRHT
jgi:hypothetical protein